MEHFKKKEFWIIVISLMLLITSFFINGYYRSVEIKEITEIGFWNLTDLYSLILIPLSILFIILKRYRLALIICYILILFQFHFFRNLPSGFEFDTINTIIDSIFYVIIPIGIYVLSRKHFLVLNKPLFTIVYYIFIIGTFIIVFNGYEQRKVRLLFEIFLVINLLYILNCRKIWIFTFMFFSVITFLMQSYYLRCYYGYFNDLGYIDFSIGNMCNNCLKNYFWLISSLMILFVVITKLRGNRTIQ